MTETVILRAIRHQTWDALLAMRQVDPGETLTGDELKKSLTQFNLRREFIEAKPYFSLNDIPDSVRHWPALRPVENLIIRLDEYIKAAEAK